MLELGDCLEGVSSCRSGRLRHRCWPGTLRSVKAACREGCSAVVGGHKAAQTQASRRCSSDDATFLPQAIVWLDLEMTGAKRVRPFSAVSLLLKFCGQRWCLRVGADWEGWSQH